MEVGAVKQAFNNEVIHLKKNLNQAKIQIIHKLTRKAKTLNQKKLPEKLQGKLQRKAESAIKEVLLIKKIKCKDIAKFAVSHTEDLQKYLNKPLVDNDKACARLLLHKSLQDKYTFIRSSFSNIPIKDLLMSREERRKIKKELKEQQKEQRKSNQQKVSNDDESDVEDLLAKIKNKSKQTEEDGDSDIHVSDNEDDMADDQSVASDVVNDDDNVESDDDDDVESNDHDDDIESNVGDDVISNDDNVHDNVITGDSNENRVSDEISALSDDESLGNSEIDKNESDDGNESSDNDVGQFVKVKTPNDIKKPALKPPKEDLRKKLPKKNKDNNKLKFNEKILKKRQKIDKVEEQEGVKVIDPFFKTVSGESYMSLAEPRAPDEVKEVHQQGNRKMRRAVMFGHAPKHRPRRNFDDGGYGNNDKYNKNSGKDTDNFQKGFNSNKNSKTGFKSNGFANDKVNNRKGLEKEAPEKPVKLHPSWEAKKRISSILPFQGKKIVFDES